jgi:mannan endo-1,4-beta-mannosidase
MSTTSNTNNLTTFGNDIINNANYGLKAINGCGATNLLSNEDFAINSINVNIYPNPSKSVFTIAGTQKVEKVTAFDVLGKDVELNNLGNNQFSIEKSGIYFLKIELEDGARVNQKLVIN